MSSRVLKELNLDPYARLLSAATGGEHPLALCDREGTILWSDEDPSSARLPTVLAELAETGFEWRCFGEGAQRCKLGNQSLLFAPIRSEQHGEVGRLVLLPDESGKVKADDLLRVGHILHHISQCVVNELRLAGEVTDIAGELSERYEELNLVYALDGHAELIDEGSAGLQNLLKSFADYLGLDVVSLVEQGKRKPIYATNLSEPMPNLDLLLSEMRGDLFRFVATSRSALVLNDLGDTRRQYLLSNLPFKLVACPVVIGRTVEAMLVLVRHPDRPDFSNSDRNLGQVIASQTAIMMRNRAMLKKMERFSQEMASALIEAVEAKDPYTRGHSERVQGISLGIGKGVQLRQEKMEGVFWGALLHDIGKIGVPDAILCKAGRLTPEEYTFIKVHPERSYEIMKHIQYLGPDALEGARYHQERFDGKGYPHGLKGDEIPLTARVISVADTYDAITSSRTYRPQQSHEVAMETIARVAGSQLDPDIVATFHELVEKDVSWLKAAAPPDASDD